jgi:hypothetical protein
LATVFAGRQLVLRFLSHKGKLALSFFKFIGTFCLSVAWSKLSREETWVEPVQLIRILCTVALLCVLRDDFGRRVESECGGFLLETRQLAFDLFDWVRLLSVLAESIKDSWRHFDLGIERFAMLSVVNNWFIELGCITFVLPILGLLAEAFGLHFY